MNAFRSGVLRIAAVALVFLSVAGRAPANAVDGLASGEPPAATAQKIIAAAFAEDEFIRTATGPDRLVAEDELDAAIVALMQRGDIAGAFRLCMQALVVSPADDTYGARILRALSLIEYSERGTGIPVDQSWSAPMFAAAASFPEETAVSQLGRCVQAGHLGLRREFPAQRTILESLARDPGLLDELRPRVYQALGGVLEQLNEPALAANAYARLVEQPLAPPDQCAALLRAALLYLHTENEFGAERMLNALAQANPWARACAVGAEQIDDLLRLQGSNRTAYWQRWQTWWPAWEKLASALELPPPGAETTAPVIANDLAVRVALKPAIDAFDRKAFFQELRRVISATRWLPRYGALLGPWIYTVERIAPEVSADFRALVIAVLEATRDELAPGPRREADLWLAIAYADDRQGEKSLAVVDALRPHAATDAEFAARLTRVHAVAALAVPGELRRAAEELEHLLASSSPVRDRAELVVILSDVYAALKDYAAEKRMLAREVEHPDVKAARRDHGRLLARLELAEMLAGNAPSQPVRDGSTVDVEARLLRRVEPPYSAALRQRGIAGQAVVEFLVGASGNVTAVRVLFATHAVLGDLAAAAVAKWEFEPALRDGRRVSTRMKVPVYFPAREPNELQAVASRGAP